MQAAALSHVMSQALHEESSDYVPCGNGINGLAM